jgi:hypothetical protein
MTFDAALRKKKNIAKPFEFGIDCHRGIRPPHFGNEICAKTNALPNSFYCLGISKYY